MRTAVRGLLAAILLAPRPAASADNELAPAPPAETDSAVAQKSPVVTDILVVLDATSSMAYRTASETGASRIDLGRIVTSAVLDVAPEGIRLGVLTLRDDVSELRPLQPMSAADRTVIRHGVQKLFPFGEGNLVSCFQRVIDKLDADATPLVVLVTDGSDYRVGSANLAAKQMKERFGGRMKFVLVGICKQGEIADRLQTLGSFAGGDSLSLTSENDIPAGLATVRETCDEVRRHRARLQRQIEKQRDDLLAVQAQLRAELTLGAKQVDEISHEMKSCLRRNQALTKELSEKTDEANIQKGQIHEQTHHLATARDDLQKSEKANLDLTVQNGIAVKVVAQATKLTDDLKKKHSSQLAEIEKLNKTMTTRETVITGLNKELKEFKDSWASSLVNHETLGAGVLFLLLLGSGGGGSAIATKLLSAKFGLLGTGLGQANSVLEEQTKKAEEGTQKLDQLTEATGRQFDSLRQEIGQQFAGVTEATGRMQEVSQSVSTSLTDVAGRVSQVGEAAAATHADVVERLSGVRSDGEKQSQELKASLERNVDQLRGAVVEKVDAPVRLMVDSLKELENRLAACVNQAASRLDERLPATVAVPLQAALTDVRTQIDVVTTQTSRLEESLPERIRSTMQSELAELRSTIETGRDGVDQMKDALRQDVERSAGETIRRINEASSSLIAPAFEGIREIRSELARQTQKSESWIQQTRDSVDRVSREVDQIPERMKATGKKISSVQQAVGSIRDQIEQLRHQSESGFHDTERRRLEQRTQDESRASDLFRATSIRDEMILNLQNEFASLTGELRDVSPALSTQLSRMDMKLQSILSEMGSTESRADTESATIDSLKARMDEFRQLVGDLKTTIVSSADGDAREVVFSDTETTIADDVRVVAGSDTVVEVPAASDEAVGESAESDLPPAARPEPVEETQDDPDEKKKKRTNRWIRELRLLKGLGKKSAATLVDTGVNSIRELSDLPAGQREALRDDGLRDIDEWVKAARKVRLLNNSLGLSLKEAVEFVKSNTWPERFLRLPDSELSELSTEFPEILDWVRDSRPTAESDHE